ncbi:MAG TPA: tetratricopeptide repeat protein [Gemmatimonadales bacterium]|nr:tetratricopeptide repeat protein [Gemmatimonadales bacterium]
MQEQTADRLLARARERFMLQDYHGVLHIADELLGGGYAYADAHQLRGLALALLGHPERALDAFDAALAINPRYSEALVHRGIVLSDLGRTEEAAESLARAAAERDGRLGGLAKPVAGRLSNLHAELGEAYAEAGLLEDGIREYRRALELGPAFHDLRFRLARHMLAAGHYLDARDELEKVIAARPEFEDARATLGLARYLSGDAGGAREIWRVCRDRRPDDARVGAYLAMVERIPR